MERKAALITGSARRLGAFISEILASYGYDLILHYNKSYGDVVLLKNRLEETYKIRTHIYQEDLILSGHLGGIIDESFAFFPYLNLLVNNASFFVQDSVETSSQDLFDSYYRIHVLAPLILMQRFISHNPKGGKVINIVDALVKNRGSKKYFSYLFSKKCLYELTLMINASVQSGGIRFYSVNPEIVIKDDGNFEEKNLTKFKDDLENILRT
ncbi:SDR family NAD(P)-dependent oxidoreductase [Neorickettsia sennetsu]|uniref:Conserved domain protein n=1 Tax=Ehrlichia sennetsu (strain ATCC VR-367 / Miyayama) TaxID=222891 RepID=Q2GCG6_EHRS3|nr:SDR family NAD(P)-dependent oxidoreductase [Neorickettsia sennetsu]ABD46070.1 conserved domain protein [Neorickettsia sennetsu str. Miyayama]